MMDSLDQDGGFALTNSAPEMLETAGAHGPVAQCDAESVMPTVTGCTTRIIPTGFFLDVFSSLRMQ